jgi:hypothetical protein
MKPLEIPTAYDIVRKFLNIDTEHNTQQSQNAEARRQ